MRISWLIRLVTSRGNWPRIPQDIGIDKCLFLGCGYAKEFIKRVTNPFWNSILESVIHIQSVIKCKNVEVQLPLWYIKDLDNLNFPKWRKNRIVLTSDVLTEEGTMFDQKGIENTYSLKTNLIEFGIFKHWVENYLDGFVNLNLQLCNFEKNTINSFFNSIINLNRKGANKLYNILKSNKGNTCLDLSQ